MKRILIWFRNDLRIHDQKNIITAIKYNPDYIIPLYCFDERQFMTTSFGFSKTGKFRGKFLLESITDLKANLQKLGSNLIVRQGITEDIIAKIAIEYQVDLLLFSEEATSEEINIEKRIIKKLNQEQIKIKSTWQSTLYHSDQLPFSLEDIPDLFTNFRTKIEKKTYNYICEKTPHKLPPIPNIEIGQIPSLQKLGLTDYEIDSKVVLQFRGGETEGIKRLNNYFWKKDCLKEYKKTRNGMLGADYSSKFSPWLAHGCLSPRFIYQEVKKYEAQRVKNDSTYWLIFELLWRDFFRLIALKHGNRLFYISGLKNVDLHWQENWSFFEVWCEGQTGYPLIDANMRELKATGFMSNRGRQNVASFLTKNLGVNWPMGAEWFESLLIDYDVCSNWGNWNYLAGIGNDARGFRNFNITKQSQNYDRNGDYLRHWLPEIASIKGEKIHQPWMLSREEQEEFAVKLGTDYPYKVIVS